MMQLEVLVNNLNGEMSQINERLSNLEKKQQMETNKVQADSSCNSTSKTINAFVIVCFSLLFTFLYTLRFSEVRMNIYFQINELERIIQKNHKQEAEIIHGL